MFHRVYQKKLFSAGKKYSNRAKENPKECLLYAYLIIGKRIKSLKHFFKINKCVKFETVPKHFPVLMTLFSIWQCNVSIKGRPNVSPMKLGQRNFIC